MTFHIFFLLAIAATTTAHCTRPLLTEAVNSYLSVQGSGQPSLLTPHLENSTWLGYFENSLPLPINSSILSTALPITHTRTLYDITSCASYTEMIVNSTTNPHVIGTQLRFNNHKINKIDTIVTKPGDWLFNVTGYAYWTAFEDWSTIPEEKRDTRETIKAAADAYCDLFSNPNVTVPWGTPCVRLEGGLYGDAGANGTCAGYIPTGVPLGRRRYVVDEMVGAVSEFLSPVRCVR
jgi:hypothetical protein